MAINQIILGLCLIQASFPQALQQAFKKGTLIDSKDSSIFVAAPNENNWFVVEGDTFKSMPPCDLIHGKNHYNLSLKFKHRNKIYFIGGYGYFLHSGSVRVFDLETNKWNYPFIEDEYIVTCQTPYAIKADTLFLISWSILDNNSEQNNHQGNNLKVVSLDLNDFKTLKVEPSGVKIDLSNSNVNFSYKGVYYFFNEEELGYLYAFNFIDKVFIKYEIPKRFNFDVRELSTSFKLLNDGEKVDVIGQLTQKGELITFDLASLISNPVEKRPLIEQVFWAKLWVQIAAIFSLLGLAGGLWFAVKLQIQAKFLQPVRSKLSKDEFELFKVYLKGNELSMSQINDILKLGKKDLGNQKTSRSNSHKKIVEVLQSFVFLDKDSETILEDVINEEDKRLKSKRINQALLAASSETVKRYLAYI